MKNLLLLFAVCFALYSCSSGRPHKEFVTFEELEDPTQDTLSDWTVVPKGLHASIVSADIKYPRSVVPEVPVVRNCTVTGWKGEILSAQVLLWSAQPVTQVECEFGEFKSDKATLPASVAQARFVRYVMVDEFGPGCGYRKPENFAASLSPDMLDSLTNFNMDAKTVRPVWLTFDIPSDAVAGVYRSKLKIYSKENRPREFEITINVQNQTLPPASEWAFHLDLWQHPSAVARAQQLELWSDAHFEAMKPLMKMLAGAGQKVITANLNKDPWNVQCYDAYADMIKWTKNADGTWSYDYTIFDKWVNFMMEQGVTGMINCYSLAPWNDEIHYFDAAADSMVNVVASPKTKVFEEMWTPFLTDFKGHLAEKDWLKITNIAMDERAPEVMTKTIGLIQKVSPEIGISLADNHKSYKKYPFIKDMSVSFDAKVDSADIAYRKANGLNTTYYVCCSDKFPNVFTFSSSAEAVYSAWYAYAAGYDGYLRWAYNSWVENPLLDSRFRTWPSGDTYIVYPDARTSIRFERLREGIQDIEKVKILRAELAKQNTPEAQQKLKSLNDEVALFADNMVPPEPCYIMLNKAKELINKLSE